LDGVVEFFGFVGVVSMGGTEDAATVEQVPGSSAINVFVTGQPGVGKTSLVLNAVKKLPQEAVAGFYTLEARNPKTGEKIGLDVETFAGERAPLSRLRRGCGTRSDGWSFRAIGSRSR
jgi:GTPase SAR1 family protein